MLEPRPASRLQSCEAPLVSRVTPSSGEIISRALVLRIFGSEVENMADLDPARRYSGVRREAFERQYIVLLGGCGIKRSPLVDNGLHGGGIIEVDVGWRRRESQIVLVTEDLAFA